MNPTRPFSNQRIKVVSHEKATFVIRVRDVAYAKKNNAAFSTGFGFSRLRPGR